MHTDNTKPLLHTPAADNQLSADQTSHPPLMTPGTTSIIPENGGVSGLEPTRYGDWEKNGRCIDF